MGIYLNGFTPNSTGHEILLKMGVNSWIYTQFEQYFMPGQIWYHSNEFNWHLSQWIYSQFDRSNLTRHEILLKMGIYLNGFTPNLTRHEILLKMGVNS